MLIAISQRQDKNQYGDHIDSLENNYVNYLSKFGIKLIVIPNTSDVNYYFDNFPIEGVILSGGNDIVGYGNSASEYRDAIEKKMLDIAVKKRLPVLGICRGMQFINIYFGGKLVNVEGHVAVNHKISINNIGETEVNSYHGLGITKDTLSPKLKSFAKAGEIIEGINHPKLPIAGIEWHPERKSPDEKINKRIIKAFVDGEMFWK
jgi:N5-(cytidine 5'-diphosphoramidyl)-L-glutamine hydrolase